MATNSLAVIADEVITINEHGRNQNMINRPNPSFLEGPSSTITLQDLSEKSIVPFYRDFEPSISHQLFIQTVMEAAKIVFGEISEPEIRVSHEIRARKPHAISKPKSELTEADQTLYYERLCWLCNVPGITTQINGQEMTLSFGGVRSYQGVRFHSRKTSERFSFFIGASVKICSNQCISTSGSKISIQCNNVETLFNEALSLFSNFNIENNLKLFGSLQDITMTESQLCSVLGRMRLLNAMSLNQQRQHPQILLGDSNMNAVARLAVQEGNPFRMNDDGSISLWNFHNLLTESIKNSYIDTVLPKWTNATDLSIGLVNALNGNDSEGYSWFLN